MSSLLIFFVLLAGIPLPAAMAADEPVVNLTSTTSSVYGGNKLTVWQSIGNITNSVYQQVYGYEAKVSFDSSKLELSTVSTQTKFNTPQKVEISSGSYRFTTDLKNVNSPIALTTSSINFLGITVQSKAVTQVTTATITASDIYIINKDGNKLKVADVSYTVTINPAGNKDQLKVLVAGTGTAREGVWNGQYPVGSMTAFTTVYNASRSLATGNETSQEKIDQQYAALQAAYTALQANVITNNPVPTLPDGEYSLGYTIYKELTNEQSVMNSYVDPNSGKLTVQGGKKYVSFTLKQHAEILSLKTKQNGILVETDKLNENTANNTRIVKFEVTDLSKRMDGWVKIYWDLGPPIGIYDNEYNIEIGFNNIGLAEKGQLNSTIADAQAKHAAAVEGSANGEYPVGSKATLLTAITAAQTVALNTTSTQAQVDQAVVTLQAAVTAFTTSVVNPSLADGQYIIDFATLKETTDAESTMNSYFLRPIKLNVQQGVKKVSFTLKDTKTVTSLKVEKDGVFTETDILSTDTAANTRVVEFEVADLKTILRAKVHVSTPMGNGTFYEMDHIVRLKFNSIDTAINVTTLKTLIASAQTKHDAAVEGTANGQYAAGSKAILLSAITAANTTLSSTTSTQVQVDQAVVTLQAAVTAFNASVVTTQPNTDVYDIGFKIFKTNSDEASVMYDYVDKTSGKLTLKNGKKYVSFVLNQNAEILSFKTKLNASSSLVETTTASTDTAANKRTVEFEVEDLTKKVDGWVKIYWVLPAPIGIYDHEYDVQVGFSNLPSIPEPANKAILSTLISSTQSKHDTAVEGTSDGQYPAGSKAVLLTAITAAQTVASNAAATQAQVDQAVVTLQAAVTTFTSSVIKVSITDGEYIIDFTTLQETTDTASSMNGYFLRPIKLNVKQGVNKVSFTLKDSSIVTSLKVEKNGVLTETSILSTDTVANTRVVEFEVADFNAIMKAQVHVSTMNNGAPYEKDHNIRLKFNSVGTEVNITALNTLIVNALAKHDEAVEGIAVGQYPAGAKATLQTAINQAKATAGNAAATQTLIDQAGAALQAALTVFNASVISTSPGGAGSLGDGEYNIDYTIYKKGTNEESVMYEYVDPKSGKLVVQGEKKYVSFTLKQSAEILNFKTKKNGALVETTTVSSNPTSNTRVIQFEVDDLKARLDGWVKIYWQVNPTFLYDHEYDVEIGFSNIQVTDPGTEYSLNFTALHATKDEVSSMNGYFIKPGKLTVQQGKKKVSFTVNQSTIVPSFKVEQNGALVETAVVSTDTTANTRVVEFEVGDLTALLNAKVHVSTKLPNGNPYEMDHSIRLRFDVGSNTQLNALITDAQSKHDAAVEGTADGQYPAGTKATLQTAINQAKVTASNAAATQAQLDQAVAALQAALTTFNASVISSSPETLPEGEYNIAYTIYKKGTNEESVMYEYADPKSGKLLVQGGKKYVSFTLKQSAEILNFKTMQNGALAEAATASSDALNNTRVVKFEVNDLNKRLDGWVKIYWQVSPTFLYDHEYDVEIGFRNITVDMTKPVNDGQYNFEFTAVPDDPTAAPVNTYVDTAGSLKIQNSKKTATIKLKNGVTVKKILQLNSDGTVNKELTPQYSAKQSGLVRVLANETGTSNYQFELEDLTAKYEMHLLSGGVETSYKLQFSSVSPVGKLEDITKPDGNGSNPGNPGNPGKYIADGTYSLNYRVLKYETDRNSVMQDYVVTPGYLTVSGGKQYFSMTLKQSKEVTALKTENNGSLTDVEVVERNNEKNTRLVKFEVKNLSSRLKGWVKVDWAEINYFHEYDVEFSFDELSLKKISSDAVLGGGAGAAVASLKNGEYDLGFQVLQHKNTLESKYNDVVAHPAKLIIKDGKRSVAITINDHKLVDDFKVETEKTAANTSDSSAAATVTKTMESATVVSKDEEANTRVVSMETKDLTAPVHVQLDIVIPPTEADLEEHKKAVEKAAANNSDDGYIPMLQKKLEKVDVDFIFDMDALGKKAEEQLTATEPSTENPTAPVAQAGLNDVQGHWAKASIERAVGLGIVNGYEDGSFRPDGEISRAEFTVLIGRALKLEGKQSELNYTDLASIPTWAKSNLEQAVGAGIISSYEDGTFRAERKITRSEIAVMIVRALGLPLDSKESMSFTDAKQIPDWASSQVAAAAKKGIINGRDNNLFAPNASATRAEAVTLILALLNHK
ncbi:hypothetical protein GC093_15060 [Paenibacillus sp. LMG 31456]|uniref:Uncharacterized protein n=2 Tax=Paenibacillus foliorum TaxID=2654974 RepID=A0A972GPP0_9BACL|nr:hypothetical protein [Paenibacillus foliorum]